MDKEKGNVEKKVLSSGFLGRFFSGAGGNNNYGLNEERAYGIQDRKPKVIQTGPGQHVVMYGSRVSNASLYRE